MHGDRELFEMLVLESFQSGLSWLTILRKKEGFTRGFDDWDVDAIAAYDEPEIERLVADPGIVRHRGKIEATIANARAVRSLRDQGETLDGLLWSFAAESDGKRMAKELKSRGFRFVGPTTAFSLMQAAGLVNDHLEGCAFR
jgi:DNA-3-methyladenine glycosylase I